MVFGPFESPPDGMIYAVDAGRRGGLKGGKASTTKKRTAARANGKLGGRPPTRTFWECILRRPLSHNEHSRVFEAFFELTKREQKLFKAHFRLPEGSPEIDTDFRYPKQKPAGRMRHILKRLRLSARWLLSTWCARSCRRTIRSSHGGVIALPIGKPPTRGGGWITSGSVRHWATVSAGSKLRARRAAGYGRPITCP